MKNYKRPNPRHKPTRHRTTLTLLAGFAILLTACSDMYDVRFTNSCGEPVLVGLEGGVESNRDFWDPIDEDATRTFGISSSSTSFRMTVIATDGDLAYDHTKLNVFDLDRSERPDGFEVFELDLATEGLCPE